jgi:hypothetical protein
MSFNCTAHGWQHLLNPCPRCSLLTYSGASTSDGQYYFPESDFYALKAELSTLNDTCERYEKALDSICGGRCDAHYNPCEAREALEPRKED